MRYAYLLCVLLFLSTLTGCVAPVLFVGGVATGAVIADDRRSTSAVVYDKGIDLKAGGVLDGDAELRAETHINVTSFNSVVLLSGEAPTTLLRYRAETLVRDVPNVRRVYNEITVGYPSSMLTRSADTVLTARVKGAISANKFVDANHVKIVTESGVVFLLGLVTHAEAEQSSSAARAVSGVVKVVRLFEFLD